MAQDPYSSTFSYYSGSQITVWFGNILIDDIYSIQWVRTQNKMPIYGYASQNFDAIANGTVLIQGNFVINFRQQNYMSYVMKSIKDLYQAYNSESNAPSGNPQVWSTVQNLISQHLQNGTFGPQTANDIIALGNSPNFFQLADDYASAVWGSAATQGATIAPADVEQSSDIPNGFLIQISYGAPPTSDAQTTVQLMQSTTKTLNNVHLVGESQIIQVGGQPVQEQYSFIAKNTDQ
jgi:hypothetical protein